MSKEVPRKVEVDGGRLLRIHRAGKRLSQAAFGLLIGSTASQVSEWENGATPSLTKATLIERVTLGEVPATSWVDTSAFGHFAEQGVQNLANGDEAATARGGRAA